MDISAILSAISSVGFPIACCIVMGWYVKDQTDKNREDLAKINEQHKHEMTEIAQAVNNNTLALQRLCDKLDAN